MDVKKHACSLRRKKRKIPLIRGAGLILLFLFLTKFFLRDNKKENTIQEASIIPEMEWADVRNNLPLSSLKKEKKKKEDIILHKVKKGENLYTIFSNYNVNKLENNLIFKIFKHLELSSLFPGDSILIKKSDSCYFSSITIFSQLKKTYVIENSDSMLYGKTEIPELSQLTYIVTDTIETSLSEALYRNGVSDVVTANIADIFAWDIDFFTDPRKGDGFQIIFEKKVVNGKVISDGNVIAAKYTLKNDKCFYAFCLTNENEVPHYYDENGKALQKEFLKAPLRYSRISSGYSHTRKHPILGIVRPHLGIDYAAPTGTPVYAAADGKILFAGVKGDYGKLIIISHGSLYQTYYGHLSSFGSGIYPGKFVKQGDFIGRVGATGLATGPHLDYRIVKYGVFINPNSMKSLSVSSVPKEKTEEFLKLKEFSLALFNNRFTDKKGCYVIDTKINPSITLKSITMNKNSSEKKIKIN